MHWLVPVGDVMFFSFVAFDNISLNMKELTGLLFMC